LKKANDKLKADMANMEKAAEEERKYNAEQKEKDAKELEKLKKELYSTKVDVASKIESNGEGEAGSKARQEGWGWMIDSITADEEGAEELLKTLWDKYDTDKNGELSKAEIKSILMDLSKAKQAQLEKDMPKVLAEWKKKPDSMGMNKKIIPALETEFKEKIEKQKKRSEGDITDEELDFLFSKLDVGVAKEGAADSDGKVSKEEFCTHGKTVFLAQEMAAKKQKEDMEKAQKEMEEGLAEMRAALGKK